MKKYLIALLFLIIILYINRNANKTSCFDDGVVGGSGKLIYWFHSPGCGHCKKMEAEWDKFEGMIKNKGFTVKRINIDTPENKNIVAQFHIDGVPHIVKIINGKQYVYEGNRTSSEFYKWATQ